MMQATRYLPPEWAPQSAVMLTWPHAHSDWAEILDRVEPVYVHIALEVTRREQLLIACYDAEHRAHIRSLLDGAGVDPARSHLHIVPSNDTWARDHGPITVIEDGKPRLLDFRFNGWGRKYDYRLDNAITQGLHELGAFGTTPRSAVDLILEGGSIESDGHGTLMTTSNCLLSPQRNPQYNCVGLEEIFQREFGIRRVLWLEKGHLAGDDTDSHIDTLARFCDAHTIAYVSCDDPQDEHYSELQEMEAELREFRDYQNQPYRLVPLPIPEAKYNAEGKRLPATHANFLIINGAVLVPTYDSPKDTIALKNLAGCFPAHEIIAIPALPLIQQFGSVHCITMQLPESVV